MPAPTLRPFQQQLCADIDHAWAQGAQNVMAVAATGSGKTVVLSHLMQAEAGYSLAIAHRQELVSQISTALARNGVPHRLLTSGRGSTSALLRIITALHTYELGQSFISERARVGVVGVDTMIRCKADEPWFDRVRLTVCDEAHHVTKVNKWGKAFEMLPKARGLLPTATPCRADGKGLGRHAHGLADAMVLAPSMRQIIDMGYLTDYRIFCPTSSKLHRAALQVGSGGDFRQPEMVHEVKKAQIVGDVVAAYLKHGKGKRGVTFCVDVEEAETQAAAFRAAGVPAAALSALSPDNERARVLQQLRSGDLMQVTNVDLFGEGFDLPAIEIVQFARPTQSFGLYVQQFGRVLRLMLTPEDLRGYNDLTDEGRRAVIALSGKPYGTIIDHVGNVEAHGLPDKPRMWSLDAREARSSTPGLDDIPLRICLTCTQPFERVHKVCPWCGAGIPEPESRSRIECVDGDLIELSVEALAALRGEIARIDGDARVPYGLPPHAVTALHRRHAERQEAQRDLRSAIAWWAGYQSARGASESESYRRFYLRYGVDVGTAQTLGRPEAAALAERVHADMQAVGVDSSQCAITWAQRRADER
jgi:superfamily II DNA or RNA helicase